MYDPRQVTLSKEDAAKFRKAVQDDYYFNMFYDNLPVYGFIGKVRTRGVRGGNRAPSLRSLRLGVLHFSRTFTFTFLF
jgi:hypothetical protein